MIVIWFSFAKNFLISIGIFCTSLDRQATTQNSTYTGWEVLGTEVPFNSIFIPVYDTLSIHMETKLASFSFLPNAEAPGVHFPPPAPSPHVVLPHCWHPDPPQGTSQRLPSFCPRSLFLSLSLQSMCHQVLLMLLFKWMSSFPAISIRCSTILALACSHPRPWSSLTSHLQQSTFQVTVRGWKTHLLWWFTEPITTVPCPHLYRYPHHTFPPDPKTFLGSFI